MFVLVAVAAMAAMWPGSAAATVRADTVAVDSTLTPESPRWPRGPFSVTGRRGYLRRHAYSFDDYLQYEPGVELSRRGPLGGDVTFSRYGIGRGRGLVVHNGIVLNDPQNDIAPLVHVPVSGVGTVSDIHDHNRGAGIEGVLRVDDMPAPPERPRTFLGLSKGTNNLRQRRVQFASADGPLGIDLSYDELLNDGYAFDASETVGINALDFGSSTSRNIGVRVRGRHDAGRFTVGFREFTSAFNGDLSSSGNELRRSGHLATATAAFGRVAVRLYERGFSATYPDSHTVNQTTAASASVRLGGGHGAALVLDAGFEDITATERVKGGESSPTLARTMASVASVFPLGTALTARAFFSGSDYHGYVSQWGGGVALVGMWKPLRAGVEARRSYRMPNLGEMFLPAHSVGGITVVGNKYLDAEYAWEASGHAAVTAGAFVNEVRVTGIRVKDPVAARYRVESGRALLSPANTAGALLYAIEDRLNVDGRIGAIELHGEAAATWTEGDRVGFFATAPRSSVRASLRVGGAMFESTSALYAGVDYIRGDERTDLNGVALPAYDVINFTLDGRLLDADMYLVLLNAFDEAYRTEGNYLMTPRTFVYGISWTLWE